MIRLILVRHGNTFESSQTPTMVGARSDLPLTAQGCEQALQFARTLSSENIRPKAIYAGSLQRQILTAEIVREHLLLEDPVQSQQAALTEIDYGAWEGLTQEEILQRWPQEVDDWTAEARWAKGIFGGSWEEHMSDIQRWIDHLRTKYAEGDQVVAATSNGVMRFFYSLQEKEWQRSVFERQIERLKVKTGHFCELQIFKDSINIQRWNVKP